MIGGGARKFMNFLISRPDHTMLPNGIPCMRSTPTTGKGQQRHVALQRPQIRRLIEWIFRRERSVRDWWAENLTAAFLLD